MFEQYYNEANRSYADENHHRIVTDATRLFCSASSAGQLAAKTVMRAEVDEKIDQLLTNDEVQAELCLFPVKSHACTLESALAVERNADTLWLN